MMKRSRLTFIVFLLLGMLSCRKEPSPEIDDEEVSQEIDDKIQLSLFNQISAVGEQELQFKLRTDKVYPCSNYSLTMKVTFNDGGMQTDITGINVSDICLTSGYYALGFIDWRQAGNGVYPLNVRVFGEMNTGTLTVDNHGYTLDFPIGNKLVISNAKLFRIPEKTIWGTIGYADQAIETELSQFFEDLKAIGGTPLSLTEGDYGHFQTTEQGDMAVPELHGSYFMKTLLYRFEGDNDDLNQLAKRYGQRDKNVNINIYSASGDRFRSWAP